MIDFSTIASIDYEVLKTLEEKLIIIVLKSKSLVQYNLRVVRAYLMKEDFEWFWEYKSPYWAGRFLDDWCVRTIPQSNVD